MTNTKILWTLIVAIIIIILFFVINPFNFTVFDPATNEEKVVPENVPALVEGEDIETKTNEEQVIQMRAEVEVIGQSADGNDISAYTFGSGEKQILLVSGIHGGYSWNTSQLAYELINYLSGIKDKLTGVRVTVIPLLNPDGLKTVFGVTGELSSALTAKVPANTVSGRFNGNNVDLNRNFDCQWSETGVWQNKSVSGGDSAFSEPEAQALRSYVAKYKPTAVIAYYSSAGGVYASNCNVGVTNETKDLLRQYATAADYAMYESYDYYATTGDMANWFAKEGVPAISVLLTNHTTTELAKNRAGLMAVINAYSEAN